MTDTSNVPDSIALVAIDYLKPIQASEIGSLMRRADNAARLRFLRETRARLMWGSEDREAANQVAESLTRAQWVRMVDAEATDTHINAQRIDRVQVRQEGELFVVRALCGKEWFTLSHEGQQGLLMQKAKQANVEFKRRFEKKSHA